MRVAERWKVVALATTGPALLIALPPGPWGFGATVSPVSSAWVCSAEPVRLKRSRLREPGLVRLCFEWLPWFNGAAVMAAGAPCWAVAVIAALRAAGERGIIMFKIFKPLHGDRETGVRSSLVVLWSAGGARWPAR